MTKKRYSYISVSTANDEEAAMEQSSKVMEKLQEGYKIISAVSDGRAIHYILEKVELA